MWYKLKRIMMRPNGVEKQVRPSRFEYSYDFRNKTVAQAEADWWVMNGNNYFDSNGYYCANQNYSMSKSFDFSKASKITITSNMYIYGWSWTNWCYISLSSWDKYAEGAARWENNNWYRWVYIICDTWWEVVRTNQYAISGDTVFVMEIDMNTRVITVTATNQWNTQTWTYTLQQATIDGIKTATAHLDVQTRTNTNHRIKDIHMVIE